MKTELDLGAAASVEMILYGGSETVLREKVAALLPTISQLVSETPIDDPSNPYHLLLAETIRKHQQTISEAENSSQNVLEDLRSVLEELENLQTQLEMDKKLRGASIEEQVDRIYMAKINHYFDALDLDDVVFDYYCRLEKSANILTSDKPDNYMEVPPHSEPIKLRVLKALFKKKIDSLSKQFFAVRKNHSSAELKLKQYKNVLTEFEQELKHYASQRTMLLSQLAQNAETDDDEVFDDL
jgi:DNA repair exonuclease SbcCD ATPase subunit